MSAEEPAGDDTKIDFGLLWKAVLAGDMDAKEAVLDLVQREIKPVLRGASSIEAAELTATVQRTLLRRIRDDASAIKAATLDDFIKYVRAQARYKKRKPTRRLSPDQLPEYANEDHEVRQHDPADPLGKQPIEEAMNNEFVAGFFEALDTLGEPAYSIVMSDDDALIAKQLGVTVGAVQKRRRRIMAAIRELIGAHA